VTADDLSRRCAESLASTARAAGLTVSTAGAIVTFPLGSVALRARIEMRQPGDGRLLVAVAVETAVDTHPGFIVGVIGTGRTEGEALDTAVHEWVQMVGQAVLSAVVTRERAERYALGPFTVYPGATGFRGAQPPAWSAADHERLLGTLRPALPASASAIHAVTITAMVEPGQMAQGEARLDGMPSTRLWDATRRFPWPTSASGYILKQFYLLVPTT